MRRLLFAVLALVMAPGCGSDPPAVTADGGRSTDGAIPQLDAATPDAGAPLGDAAPVDAQAEVDACEERTFFADGDDDGHGDPASVMTACTAPEGYVAVGDDCDDACGTCHPGADETCNGDDDDCDGLVDGDAADGACGSAMICLDGACGDLVSRVLVASGSHEARIHQVASSAEGSQLVVAAAYYGDLGAELTGVRFADRDVAFAAGVRRVEIVARLDAAGRVMWVTALSFEGLATAGISGIAIDETGRAVVVGLHAGVRVGDRSLAARPTTGSFVLLLSPSGEPVTLRSFDGSPTTCAITSTSIFVGGYARESAELSIADGARRGFVAALDEDLTIAWSRVIGAIDGEVVSVAALGASEGSVVALGTFESDAPISGTTTTFHSVGSNDAFLARFSAAGELEHTLSLGTDGFDQPRALVMRGDDAIVTVLVGPPALAIGSVSIPETTQTGLHETTFTWRADGSVEAARRLGMFYSSIATRRAVVGLLLFGTPFDHDGHSLAEAGSSTARDVVQVELGADGAFTSAERFADLELAAAGATTRVDAIAGTYDAARTFDGVALPAAPADHDGSYLWIRPLP
jgi:hypothetical protein